jgi:hypothetical protein
MEPVWPQGRQVIEQKTTAEYPTKVSAILFELSRHDVSPDRPFGFKVLIQNVEKAIFQK